MLAAARPEDAGVAVAGAEVARPDAALAALERGERIDALVVGPSVEEPVTFAQRVHRIDRDVALVLVSSPERAATIEQAVRFAPFLGPDVRCRSSGDAVLLSAEVEEAAVRAEQRRRYRGAVSLASEQLAAASLHASPQATRFAGRLLDDAPLGVVAVDGDSCVVGWNRRAGELFGRTEREALGVRLDDLFAERSRGTLRALLATPNREGRVTSAVLELESASGIRYVHATASPLADAAPGPAVLVMLQDETERVAAERERETARAELAFLVDAGTALAAADGFRATIDALVRLAVPSFADWCVVDVIEGREIRRVAAAARDEELDRLAHELQERYPPTWDSPQPAARALREGQAVLLQIDDEFIRRHTVDADHHDLMLRLAPTSAIALPLAARGTTFGAVTFVRAVGSRPYAERDVALAERVAERAALALDNAVLLTTAQERARAARVLDAVGDGVFLVDHAQRVRLWNHAAARITGVAAETVVGRTLGEVVPGWQTVAHAVPVAAAGDAFRAVTVPLEVGRDELWLAIAGVAAEDGVIYAFRDVTDEVEVDRLKSEFVATVSHELRTPLASVYGAALTLLRPDVERDDGRRRELTAIVVKEAERLARIVDDILLASHLDAGGVHVEQEGLDAREIARQSVEAVRAKLADPARLRLHAAPPAPVTGDADRIRQVLGNLIDNALKYSPDDETVDVDVEHGGRWVRVWVRDRGLGIPRSEQARIFEKFYRLDPDHTRGVSGTGLGLYISRELVRRMGGRIGVESREGEGSSFFVELPARR